MTKKQLEKEWKKIIKETHNKLKCKTYYSKEVIFARELLLFAQVLLCKIENKENILFSDELYQNIMKGYYKQKAFLNF